MKKVFFVLLLIQSFAVYPQTDKIDSLLNDLLYNESDALLNTEKPLRFDFLYAGAFYGSNTFYAGREIGSDMKSFTGSLFYFSSTGLFIGTSGSWYSQLTPAYSNTTLSLGFSNSIDKKKQFTFRTSYSRIFYYKTDTLSSYSYSNNANIGLTFRRKWLGIRATGSLLFGEDYKMSLSSSLYSRFTIVKLGKYSKIYSIPELSAYFSSETVYTGNTADQSSGTTETEEKFGLLNTQLYIPLCISLSDFDFEIFYSLNFPTTGDPQISYPVKGNYGFSIGYMIPIAKNR